MRDPKNRELYKPPSPVDSVAAPRTKEQFKFPTKIPVIREPRNFKRAMARLNETGKLSLEDFNNAAEIGAFIDFHNNTVRKKKDEWANNEIVEIAKFLERTMRQKSFVIRATKRS